MLITKAPGRVGIIGNPSDGYGGAVLSSAIENCVRVTIEPAEHVIITNKYGSKTLRNAEDFDPHDDYFDLPRAVFRYFKLFDLKARLTITTAIPEQAGLAGSTATLAAVLKAVLTFIGESYDQYYFAELTRYLEYNYLGCHCGYQDAYMTTFGGLKYLDFSGKEQFRELVDEPYASVEFLKPPCRELPFVIAHTGIKHHSGKFHRPIRERWLKGEKEVVQGYRKIAEMAGEGKKALLKCDWVYLANLMNENHCIQDRISNSGEENNYMIQVAMDNGALAAKLAGAGGGGTIIVLSFDAERTKDALKRAGAKGFIQLDTGGSGVSVSFD